MGGGRWKWEVGGERWEVGGGRWELRRASHMESADAKSTRIAASGSATSCRVSS